VAGLVVGNLRSPVDEGLREFKDQLTALMIGAVFVLLAADVGLGEVAGLGWAAAAVLAALVLVVRPLAVWLATRNAEMPLRERVFISAIAPRGIVAAAIASLTAGTLSARSIEGGTELRALVFLVIAGTVVWAGIVAWPLASLLGLRLPARDRIAILGAQGLGLALARELRAAGQTVVFIDSDAQRCRAAEEGGFSVVFGDGLRERTLLRIPIEVVGTAIGATFNENLNSQFVRLARDTFGVKRGLVSVDSFDGERPPQHVVRQGADVLFDGPHDQELWDVRWRQGQVEILRAIKVDRSERPSPRSTLTRAERELFVPLTFERKGRVAPMSLSASLRAQDAAAVAVHRSKRQEAIEALLSLGWEVAPAAKDEIGTEQTA
jgi:hypothetical protein